MSIKVTCAEDCGNSPKKKLLRDLYIAFANKDIDFGREWVTENVVWDVIGDTLIQGKAEVEKAFHQRYNRDVQELHIHNIITHGNTGSINGTFILKDKQIVAFCDVYNFRGFGKNAKIKLITSYIIEISNT